MNQFNEKIKDAIDQGEVDGLSIKSTYSMLNFYGLVWFALKSSYFSTGTVQNPFL